jgi:tetratricopeptide (TPR) repeat protein
MRPSTARRIRYAEGYTALGLLNEATDELQAIDAQDRFLPEVIEAWVGVHWEMKHWKSLISNAQELVRLAPTQERGWIGWAFALRELGEIAEAKAVLLEAEPHHGTDSAVLHYNLGCYHCLLGEFNEARTRLQTAFKMHPPFQAAALEDRDLERMWNELKTSA